MRENEHINASMNQPRHTRNSAMYSRLTDNKQHLQNSLKSYWFLLAVDTRNTRMNSHISIANGQFSKYLLNNRTYSQFTLLPQNSGTILHQKVILIYPSINIIENFNGCFHDVFLAFSTNKSILEASSGNFSPWLKLILQFLTKQHILHHSILWDANSPILNAENLLRFWQSNLWWANLPTSF